MSVTFNNPPLAYGVNQPTVPVMPLVAEFNGVPTSSTRGVLGQMLLNTLSVGDIYMLTGIIAGAAQWTLVAGGAGSFNSLVVTTTITAGGTIASTGGDIVADTGDIITLAGDIVSGANMQFVGSLTSAAGNIVLSAGGITAPMGTVSANAIESDGNVYAFGDDGVGTVGSTSFTNVVDNTQGAGTLTITSASANPGTNAGFLKFYRGVTVVYVPYFTDIAP